MHPAFSVIFFTTASGAGYGMLALLGFLNAFKVIELSQPAATVVFIVAFLLITFGLIASTFHLGHPERALRAFSQWRTSWLSREGVAAVITYIPFLIFAYGWIFQNNTQGIFLVFGVIGALCSLVTVFITSMIYASLKTIHAWHNIWTPFGYLILSLMSGALFLNTIFSWFGAFSETLSYISILLLTMGAAIKWRYWYFIDNTSSASTSETATGLGHLGKVSLLESPHTQENYLQKEMGFKIARKHAHKLRRTVYFYGFLIPGILYINALINQCYSSAMLGTHFAIISMMIGVLVERWLFFAQAKHTVMLYYGRSTA